MLNKVFYRGRLRAEVQHLSLLYTISDRKGPFFSCLVLVVQTFASLFTAENTLSITNPETFFRFFHGHKVHC